VDKAIRFMESHISGDVDLESAAREAGFSPFHFHRIFTAITGETPQNCLTRLRLERAANILVKSPAISITEIAFTCGYSSASAFARAFKRYFGIPAGDYARQSRVEGRPVSWVKARPPAMVEDFLLPEIRIQTMPALHLAIFKSNAGYTPEGIKTAWVRMFQWAQGRQITTQDSRLIAISYDDPQITEMRRCRYYACMTVPETIVKDSRAGLMDIPEHLCAVCRLNVDADQVMPAYRSFYRDWLPESGFLMTDLPPYEIYYNAPDVDPTSKYVFDLCVPVEVL
jgi:AraC family transcriptional regulator